MSEQPEWPAMTDHNNKVMRDNLETLAKAASVVGELLAFFGAPENMHTAETIVILTRIIQRVEAMQALDPQALDPDLKTE